MRRNLLIFFGIVTAFFALASFATAHAISIVFGISDKAETYAIMAVLFAVVESFVFASIIGARFYNRFSRWFYAASAVGLGLLTYLFLASCVYALVVEITDDALRPLGLALQGGAVLLALYGVLNARRIVVKQVTVEIKNLPVAWHGRRMVFVSDLHLGQVNGPRFAKRVTDVINGEKPDLVCIGGDLYDGTTAPDLAMLAAPLTEIKAPLGTYFIMGNHEEFGASDAFIDVLKKLGIELLLDRKKVVEGVQLIGVDYHSTTSVAGFEAVLGSLHIDPTQPSILFKHEPRNIPIAEAHGISLQLSGHTHRGQTWPWGYVTRRIYGVFHYGLHPLGNLQVYTSSGVGTWGPPLKVRSDPEVVSLILNRA